MAAGSVHPSGEKYQSLWDWEGVAVGVPDYVRALTTKASDPSIVTTVDDVTAADWKTWLLEYVERNSLVLTGVEKRAANGWWLGIICPWVSFHSTGPGGDDSTVLGILDGKLAFECSHGSCKALGNNTAIFKTRMLLTNNERAVEPGADIEVELGTGLAPSVVKEDVDPATFFDTADQILNAEPVDFVVNNVIPKNRYTGFVALSGSRKTIIAFNIIRSVLRGEPFLGKFAVDHPPERVLFFAAESPRSELKERLEKMELVPYLQSKKLLVRSSSADGIFHQDKLPEHLLNGALVVFDTFICFFDGASEQDSTEARKFRSQMQRLVNAGATVIVLFHAPKGAKDAEEMTIETVRGSSELGAAMAACWGLAMLGPDWKDHTRMTQVKRREFQCDPPTFEFACDMDTAICTYVDKADAIVTGTQVRKAEDAKALEYLKAHLDWSDKKVSKGCKTELGIDRSHMWNQRHRED